MTVHFTISIPVIQTILAFAGIYILGLLVFPFCTLWVDRRERRKPLTFRAWKYQYGYIGKHIWWSAPIWPALLLIQLGQDLVRWVGSFWCKHENTSRHFNKYGNGTIEEYECEDCGKWVRTHAD